MSAGPWRVDAVEMSREVDGLGILTASKWRGSEGARWTIQADGDVDLGWSRIGGVAPTIDAAMEAADLWATEHGYPAVRVEVDP